MFSVKPKLILLLLLAVTAALPASAAGPLILRDPTLSRDAIVFVFAGDLWKVPRQGGEAVRLTSHPGQERRPFFSPDGTQIAFTGEYDGNVDTYVMPAAGGSPVRLTSHPGADMTVGWADAKTVMFSSDRAVPTDGVRLYTVPAAGGPATEIPLPIATEGSISPDGKHLAYVPTLQWQSAWKRYRGGQTRRVWIADLADSSITPLPHGDASEFNPMWVGDTIYFLSDREGPVTLFAYDLKTKAVRRCVENKGLDIKSACAGPGAIVLGQFDAIRLYDLASGEVSTVDIRITGDLTEARPRFKKVEGKDLSYGRLSPTGARAVFESRGEILTAPADKGEMRNLTKSPGVADRNPAWSPDGKWIAYFSDESGDYQLHLRAPSGLGDARKLTPGGAPSFYYRPVWSPDSKRIAYADKRGKLWMLDVEKGDSTLVDTSPLDGGEPGECDYSFSPDSRWLAFNRSLTNRLGAVFVYQVETRATRQVTDEMGDAAFPAWADSGKYLYFAASTDSGPTLGGDLSNLNRPVTRSVYLVVLDKTEPSPLAAESDEEKSADNKKKTADDDKAKGGADEKPKASDPAKETAEARKDDKKTAAPATGDTNAPVVKIDFENIGQRIVSVPLPARNYKGLYAGKSNALFALEGPAVDSGSDGPPATTVQRFDLAKRKAEKFLDKVKAFAVSANREKALFQKGDDWYIAGAESAPKDGEGQVKIEGFQLEIHPAEEWRQIHREAWRMQRDFFYDPGYHGLDLKAAEEKYRVYLDGLQSRADLNFLMEEMLGELTVGHMFIGGGDMPEVKHVRVGLLGADFTIENGRHRISKIYTGENYNPDLRAPLTEPGVNVAVGDYLLAVDGRDLPGTAEIYSLFQDKAGRQVALRVGPNADGTGARDVTVKTIDDEHGLRHRAWVEENRRAVDRLSGGRLAYLHVPDTAMGGLTAFNRYYFPQMNRQGVVVDERFNHGGQLDDYYVDFLQRKVLSKWTGRDGLDLASPMGANDGPKVLLINEFAGSGGDAFPWNFRRLGIGPLVGKRTWGGLVGIGGYPSLIDGGYLTAPRVAIYGREGKYEVENIGVAPDFDVELDPKAWRTGHDTQLEKAVEIALDRLAKSPPPALEKPPYPNYHQKL
jgi:tricorn protease